MKDSKNKKQFTVYFTGRDCDGYPSDDTYKFDTYDEAKSFADDCNIGSDGLIAEITDEVI